MGSMLFLNIWKEEKAEFFSEKEKVFFRVALERRNSDSISDIKSLDSQMTDCLS